MKSLFKADDNREMVERIRHLNADSKALWGKMNVSQMLAHTQQPLKVAFGELKLKRGLIGFLFGKIAKKKLLADAPWGKSLPTDKNFLVPHQPEFEKEKHQLITIVERFAKTGPTGLSMETHPFFGDLTQTEWDALMWKHLDHHLHQFGA